DGFYGIGAPLGDGGSGLGVGHGSFLSRSVEAPSLVVGQPIVMGSLDKEIIRRVMQQHQAQVRYCYERELQRSANLAGKLVGKFVIGAAGTVQQASVESQSIGDEVSNCVIDKVKTWLFPHVAGGGVVVVSFPWTFVSNGGPDPAPLPPPPPPPTADQLRAQLK